MAKTMRVIPELMIMIKGLVLALRSVASAGILSLGVTYLYAVVIRQLTQDKDLATRYGLTSVSKTAVFLLLEAILPDNADTIRQYGMESLHLALILFSFIALLAILLLNMLIGVICQVVFEQAARENDIKQFQRFATRMSRTKVDRNDDSWIDYAEFIGILNNREAVIELKKFGVDVIALVEDTENIFRALSTSDGKMHFDQFIEVCGQFRSTSTAAIGSVYSLRRFVDLHLRAINERLAEFEIRFENALKITCSSGASPGCLTQYATSATNVPGADNRKKLPSLEIPAGGSLPL